MQQPDKPIIRVARSTDAAHVANLLSVLGYPSSNEQVKERICRGISNDDDTIFVAEERDQLVGLASFHCIPLLHADGLLGRITSFVVAPSHRKRGLGRLLIQSVEEFAWAHNCVRIEVTSGDQRPDAHAFYEQAGYTVDCRRFIKKREF